jgi:translation elongation factor EF-1alpha
LQKQIGFENVSFVPVSGLTGINLVENAPSAHPLSHWYNGPTFIQILGMNYHYLMPILFIIFRFVTVPSEL